MRAQVFGNTVPSEKSSLMYVLVVSSQKDGDGAVSLTLLILGENIFRWWDPVVERAVVGVSR